MQMTDLLLTLWLVFGSFYALNISLWIVKIYKTDTNSPHFLHVSFGIAVMAVMTVITFPIQMFSLESPRKKAFGVYSILKEEKEC